jgi:asparagine synthase (glutamine-hydrolysing)
MLTADGRFVITFNGEIYNFPELRCALEASGHRFHSTSDTEVLLHGYREWGLGLLDRLRGMYAFALHDVERRETLLARDPLGIKPLYLADDGRRVAFASEVQALRRVLGDGGLDPEGLAGFLLWGSIAAPRTLDRGIRALPPACWLRIREGAVEGPIAYWRLEDELGRAGPASAEQAAEALRAALLDSVRHHMVADVPVGAFLSGGVDSSALVGLMSEVLPAPVRTVTLSLDVAELDESRLALAAAELYRTDHHDVPIRIEEVRERIGDAVRALDQPSIDGINTFFVSEAAAKTGLKVAVSGVGGDELFGGYLSFQRVPRIRSFHQRLSRWPGGGSLATAGGWGARAPAGRTHGVEAGARARVRRRGRRRLLRRARPLHAFGGARAPGAGDRGGGRRLRPGRRAARARESRRASRGRARLRARIPPVSPGPAPARHDAMAMRHRSRYASPTG